MQFQKNANGARGFMGNFLCGLERVKRFVKVPLHYMFRNLKKDKRNVDVALPLEKFLRAPMPPSAPYDDVPDLPAALSVFQKWLQD